VGGKNEHSPLLGCVQAPTVRLHRPALRMSGGVRYSSRKLSWSTVSSEIVACDIMNQGDLAVRELDYNDSVITIQCTSAGKNRHRYDWRMPMCRHMPGSH
jgi:hypothetical protein